MSGDTRRAYALVAEAVIRLRTEGRVTVRADQSRRRWSFKPYALCACGREYKISDRRLCESGLR